MSIRRNFSFVVALAVALAITATAQAAVVKLDFGTKSGTSDTPTLEPVGVQVKGGQIGVYIQSNINEAQVFTFKVTGLTEPLYDVYVKGDYVGALSAQELEQGIELSTPASVADPNVMRELKAVKPAVEAEEKALQGNNDPEPFRVHWTLAQAVDWCNSGIRNDKAWRSTEVKIAPEGTVLHKMQWYTRIEEDVLRMSYDRAQLLLQQARDRMYNNIKDADLRNRAVVCMTPVFFDVEYELVNGKPHVDAQVRSDCSLPVDVNITMALPKGWKTNAKSLSFCDIEPGGRRNISFDLIAPDKDAEAPASLPIAANVGVELDKFSAKCKLRQVALLGR